MNGENNNVRAAPIRLSTVATSTRQTPRTDFGSVMKNGLIRAGNVAIQGLQQAAPYVPGGAIISAALAGTTPAAQLVNSGSGGVPYGTSTYALTPAGSGSIGGTQVGNYGAGGTLAIPDRRPNLGTDLSNPAFGTGATASTANASTDAFNQMMSATREMTEFQASFNLQYLQLQEKIQMDTRQFNLISNIMKTKHDAAKNALNNVR